ncbi:MAG: hypothetical protein IT450_00985 [Phycisphaerales bacterium]|nr:hypothetical protein [Phycisphaerales bacterium]
MRRSRVVAAALVLGGFAGVTFFLPTIGRALHAMQVRLSGTRTIQERLEQHGPAARGRLRPDFSNAGIEYPPTRIALVGLKRDRRLLLYATDSPNDDPIRGGWRLVREYPILGASGELGPKLREGDRQVPEGIYGVESLNPNSRFHLSLRIAYPNEFDRRRAIEDGRDRLGGDIMIHGGSASVGCLAMGDPAAEELFTLAADVGIANIELILTPVDFRLEPSPASSGNDRPSWLPQLYAQIAAALTRLPLPGPPP